VGSGTGSVRDIALYFFNADHRKLFEFGMSQLPPFGISFSSGSGGAVSAVDTRIQSARAHHSIPFAPEIDDFWRIGWDTIDWSRDERLSRVVHPFFNEQMVWISIVSAGLREWLESHSVQRHYLTGVTEGHVPDCTGAVHSSIHRTPIETAIDSYLYGAGTWLRPGEPDAE
jgi:hypothetical protein